MNFHIDRDNVAHISATSSVFPSPNWENTDWNEENYFHVLLRGLELGLPTQNKNTICADENIIWN